MKKKKVAKLNKQENQIQNEMDYARDMIQNGLGDVIGSDVPTFGSQLSQLGTLFKNNRWYLISNMRQILSQIYAEHGIIQTVVDLPVDDAFKGGITIQTDQLDQDEVKDLQIEMEMQDDVQKFMSGLKWNRLYGGGGVVIMTDQDPETPFDIEAIKEDSPLEFKDVDMWELFYAKQNVEDTSTVVKLDGGNDYFDYYGQKLHKSRVILFKGIRPPSFIRPRLRGWGLSVIETLVRSINQYLKSTDLTFDVLDEFKIDIFKIKGLTNALLTKNGPEQVRKRIALANEQKNYQNAIIMDGEDDYIQKQLTFAGLSEAMAGIRMQVASDLRMPLTKLFGISASGFSSGEDDIENYNSMIESSIRSKVKVPLLKLVKIRCKQKFGVVPDDLQIEFKPLRELSSEQEENVKTQKFSRLLQAKQAGEITTEEFRDSVNKDNLLPIQLSKSESLKLEAERAKSATAANGVPAKAPAATVSKTVGKGAPEAAT